MYRYGSQRQDELIWTMWTSDHSEEWMKLYADTGLNAICGDFRAAERHGFKVWTRSRYVMRPGETMGEARWRAVLGNITVRRRRKPRPPEPRKYLLIPGIVVESSERPTVAPPWRIFDVGMRPSGKPRSKQPRK